VVVEVVLSISPGHSARYLTDAVAAGRENYYTGAVAEGEPAGRWYGSGAEQLGLRGLVDPQDMTALYEHFIDPTDPAFRSPEQWAEAGTLGNPGRRYLSEDQIYEASLAKEPHADAERRAELRIQASKGCRKNVGFLDATFNVQKSVTVLHAAFEAQEVAARAAGNTEAEQAWGEHRQAVEDAIWAGNRASMDYLATHAGFSRIGHHGGRAGRWADAHDWTIASFFQHDSREHDPHLHIHNAILNRVQGADGVWRTLDGRSLYAFKPAAGAVGERTMEAHLTRSLGIGFATRPDGKAREVVGMPPAVMELFSSRRRAITARTHQLVGAFETTFGRGPNALELDRLQRQATLHTRRAKTHTGESTAERLQRWDRELRAEVAGGLEEVAQGVLALAGQAPEAPRWNPAQVVATALAAVEQKYAAWTPPDLTREISNALPDTIDLTDGDQIAELLDRLTNAGLSLVTCLEPIRPGDEVLPEAFRLASGRSAFEAPGRRRYATPEHLHTERLLVAATTRRDAPAATTDATGALVKQLATAGMTLGPDQAAALRGVLTSGVRVETLVGPAGTGKSFVVGALAKAWADPQLWDGVQRRAFGLATSQIAASVLTGEGLTATNTARWLATQARLADGRAREGDENWQLQTGDLVVVDESSMADTAALAAVHQHVANAGAKLLLVGDHRQLSAIGAGGGMDLLASSGASYELTEARRFTATWEGPASLRLRVGDPEALTDYYKHGRLVDGGAIEQTEQAAVHGWLGDHLSGRQSLLIVDTNEQAARLSAHIRTQLVALGQVSEHGVPLGLQATVAGVGDIVQARRLAWDLAGYAGNERGPITRENYRVLQIRDNGDVVVTRISDTQGSGERLTLPADYVAADLALGYAVTVHAAEGLTVDTAHTVVTPATRAQALYPALTRGRDGNTAHIVTRAIPADAPTGAVHDAVHRDPRAVLDAVLEAGAPELSATATSAQAHADNHAITTPAELLATAAELAVTERTARWLDQLAVDGILTPAQRAQVAAEDGARKLAPLLRRVEMAGHDAHQVLTDAITERGLDGAHRLSNVIHSRITTGRDLDPVGDTYTAWTPHIGDPHWDHYLHALAEAADQRRHELGSAQASQPETWALEDLGSPPADVAARAEWIQRASAVAAHRELTGHDDPATSIGYAPAAGDAEAYASWRSAWRALGRPEADRDEYEMSNGRLHLRVRAYEREQTWAPPYVADELAANIQTAEYHRATATRRAVEAAAESDPDRRAELTQSAQGSAALADLLERHTPVLEQADEQRAIWYLHTAGTRDAAERAAAELAARHSSDPQPEQRVSASEWLELERAHHLEEDQYREIADEADFADTGHDRLTNSVYDHYAASIVDPADPDIRQVAEAWPAPGDDATMRVPNLDETADAVRRAQLALAEITRRIALDNAREADYARSQQIARWHAEDQAAQIDLGDDLGDLGYD
jgi:conjugative relaxase-like TrwC/TraI family protein